MSADPTMVRRICRAYRQASATDRATGLGWYGEAYRVAKAIDPTNPARAAGVLARMSPRMQWSTNVVAAERMIAAADAGLPCPEFGTLANRGPAWLIATGSDPMSMLGKVARSGRVISGHKIRAFYANILGDTDQVTVDAWAHGVATGEWKLDARTGDVVPADVSMSGGMYYRIAAAYRRAAIILGVPARDVQAACWFAARGAKPTDAAFHARAAA